MFTQLYWYCENDSLCQFTFTVQLILMLKFVKASYVNAIEILMVDVKQRCIQFKDVFTLLY